MDPAPHQQAALQQLAGIPGVVGSMVFGAAGELVGSVFPPVFDVSGLQELAAQLAGDGYFQEWVAGEEGTLELRYADGHVMVRAVDGTWLLVVYTAQTNPQLLAMSLTQVVRRLRIPLTAPWKERQGPSPPPPPAPPAADRLRALVTAELGGHAGQALEILGAAGGRPDELRRAAGEIEKLTRLFISKKKAQELAGRMAAILDA